MVFIKVCISLFLLVSSLAFSEAIYKYKDESGNWVFSDKKPKLHSKIETIQLKVAKKNLVKPELYVHRNNQNYVLVAKNPFYAPIEIEVESSIYEGATNREVLSPLSTTILYESINGISPVKYRWVLGDPGSEDDDHRYKIPVTSKQSHEITQTFNGLFSHSKKPNLYAVDISLRIGTYISAARGGVVIWSKDDYHMGGDKAYFLDKANFVTVLHADGTYAVYAHILKGSSLVKPGDRVKAGDKLARSGSSGYSTGPHLHFVVCKNAGLETVSIPFEFIDVKGVVFSPKKGMMVHGIQDNY